MIIFRKEQLSGQSNRVILLVGDFVSELEWNVIHYFQFVKERQTLDLWQLVSYVFVYNLSNHGELLAAQLRQSNFDAQ